MNNLAELSLPRSVPLAQTPTRIEYLSRLSEELASVKLSVKRDDLTGTALTGNKIRKLEFLLPDALEKGCDTLITCGGIQSNHARATAIVAARFGLKSILVLRGKEPEIPLGNLLLDKLVGAEIRWITLKQYQQVMDIMGEIAADLKRKGRKGYVIPTGGSNAVGSLGYLKAGFEIAGQTQDNPPDLIVTPVGSGGTMAGLLGGIKLSGLPSRVIGFCVCDSARYFQEEIHSILKEMEYRFRLDLKIEKDDITIFEDYIGPGYALSYPEEIDFIRHVARAEGLILDPVYTGKAMHGLVSEIKKGTFSDASEVLFVHTGGIFGLTGLS
ncbi:MAG: 1-aminocyclopropane-1-carboxylate deaminase/D-cysteine desulfhydrase [bacterium]